MKTVSTHGLNLSVFSLGTVQLGMNYGLNNRDGKPTRSAAFSLLDQAMLLGVNNLDTANNYGDSEKIIGAWLTARQAAALPCPWIVTKIGPLNHSSYDALRDDIYRQTDASRAALGLDTLDCLMIHDFADYDRNRDAVEKVFAEMKKQKLFRYQAISAYSRHDYGVIADSGFDAVQIPLNVFDWSQLENGGIEKLHRAGMMIFVRSVFLQGLVFHTPEDLDPRMDFCVPYVAEFVRLCREFSMTPDQLALSFVLSVPGVTTAVLGCDNSKQLASNCRLIDRTVTLEDAQMEQLHRAFRNIDPRVINPGVWFNHT